VQENWWEWQVMGQNVGVWGEMQRKLLVFWIFIFVFQ